VKDWRGTRIELARFQSLPLRTVHEVFPHTAHPKGFAVRLMSPLVAGRCFHL
jgi:hypothetical protein